MTAEDLIDRWEELRDAGQPVSAEVLCAEHPELLAEVRQRIERLAALDGLMYAPAPAPQSDATACRYETLRFHAAGGLGEVFIARDRELQREVALKRIKAASARFGESQERFKREAEITARLEHPGVAPMYGCGVDDQGLPYYAMRFIRGETMQAAIGRLYEPANAATTNPQAEPPTLARLLRSFVQVCQTIAFAHSQGVVHRDLKPGNVLLGSYGETLVVDWGLAKLERRATAGAAGEVLAAELARAPGGQGDLETVDFLRHAAALRTLGVKGSPAYMSPEQAAGEWHKVGWASDVYSLGATLYEILTGRAPFGGVTAEETLTKVRAGDFLRPRGVQRGVSAQLEAICLRAMQLAPAARYSSAMALAQDVEAWLAGEPVAAWPEPWTWRTARWLKQHRTVAVGLASSAAVAVLLLLVMNVALSAANRRERIARVQAEEYLKVARQSQAEMQQLLLGKTSGAQRHNPEFERVLTRVAHRYERLIELNPRDPRVRMDLAVANGLRARSVPASIRDPGTAALFQTTLDDLNSLRQLTDPAWGVTRQRAVDWLRAMYASRAWRWIEAGDLNRAEADYEQAVSGFHVQSADDSLTAMLLANTTLDLLAAAPESSTTREKQLARAERALSWFNAAPPAPLNANIWADARAKLQFNQLQLASPPPPVEQLLAFAEQCQQITPRTAVLTTVAARSLRNAAARLRDADEQLALFDRAERLLRAPPTVAPEPSEQQMQSEELGAVQATYIFVATKSEHRSSAQRVLEILREKSAAEARAKYLRSMFPDLGEDVQQRLEEKWTAAKPSN